MLSGDVQRTAEPWLIGKILDLGTQIVGGVYWKPVFRIVSAGPEAVHSVTHARSYLESNFFVGWRSGRRNFAVSDGDSSSQVLLARTSFAPASVGQSKLSSYSSFNFMLKLYCSKAQSDFEQMHTGL